MKTQEKMDKLSALEHIHDHIGSCFGIVDIKFAEHQNEKDRALQIKELAMRSNVSLDELMNFVAGYLIKKSDDFEFIKVQYNNAKIYFQ